MVAGDEHRTRPRERLKPADLEADPPPQPPEDERERPIKPAAPGNWAAGGRYDDRLERRDGSWKIAFRYTILEWSGMVPETQVPLFKDLADVHRNGVPSRSREDPSYRRPLTNLRALQFPDDPRKLGRPVD